MEKYNLDKLIKIIVNDFYHARYFYFEKEKRFMGFVTRKEGFYECDWGNYVGLEVPKNHIMKDGILYEKPEVILRYESDISKKYIFNTYDEAKKFADEITETGRWIS